jgi:hypothetical protein
MRRLVLLIILGLGIALAPARADALTVREIVELKRAGLGEEVLLALIEVDGGIFEINTSTLKMLKQAGVSDKVIEAMVRSGRTPRPAELAQVVPPAQPQHEVIVVEREPVVREFPVVVPVYIPIVTTTFSRHHLSRRCRFSLCLRVSSRRPAIQSFTRKPNPSTGDGEESCGRMPGSQSSVYAL